MYTRVKHRKYYINEITEVCSFSLLSILKMWWRKNVNSPPKSLGYAILKHSMLQLVL